MRKQVTMERRHFEFLAEFVRVHFGDTAATKHDIAHMLSVALQDTNPKFNKAKFVAACGCKE